AVQTLTMTGVLTVDDRLEDYMRKVLKLPERDEDTEREQPDEKDEPKEEDKEDDEKKEMTFKGGLPKDVIWRTIGGKRVPISPKTGKPVGGDWGDKGSGKSKDKDSDKESKSKGGGKKEGENDKKGNGDNAPSVKGTKIKDYKEHLKEKYNIKYENTDAYKRYQKNIAKYKKELKSDPDKMAKYIESMEELVKDEKKTWDKDVDATINRIIQEGYVVEFGDERLAISRTMQFRWGDNVMEDFDGKIVAGKKEWIGKNIDECKPAQKIINWKHKQTQKFDNLGDYANAKATDKENNLASIMYSYKAPLGMNANPVRNHAKAYFENKSLDGKNIKVGKNYETILKTINFNKKHLKSQKKWEREYAKKDIMRCKKEQWTAKLKDIADFDMSTISYNQRTVNEFASNVKKTQKYLKEKHPSGKMTLYRGVAGEYADAIKRGIKQDGKVTANTYAADSWTSNASVAQKFGSTKGLVLKKEVNISDILLSHKTTPYLRTGDFVFGGTEEYEYIVGHKSGKMTISESEVL
ncbi:MAG: hypothetical protein U9O78_04370, partial [Patescibacteria group bacterium]|nr:hypothetical protein [Patescibacteria group bacterium]